MMHALGNTSQMIHHCGTSRASNKRFSLIQSEFRRVNLASTSAVTIGRV